VSKAKKRLETLRAGGIPQVTAEDLWRGTPGEVPETEELAIMALARAIHRAESTGCAVSWSAQERAMKFHNEHGLIATLDEVLRLGGEL
jgi:hypothetical protein